MVANSAALLSHCDLLLKHCDTILHASGGISDRSCCVRCGSGWSKIVIVLISLLKAKTPEIKPFPLQYHKPPKCHHADGILTKMSRITKNSFLSSHVLRGEQGSICILSATVVARTNNSCWSNSQPSALSCGFRHTFNFERRTHVLIMPLKLLTEIIPFSVPFITQLL